MQHELKISLFDLRTVLLKAKESSAYVDIELVVGGILEACSVLEINESDDKLIVNHESSHFDIRFYEIRCVEFKTFFSYKGESSKIFSVE